nr:PREDICTED: ras-related protein Rab-24 [Lepisosteus oculatus]
MSGQRVDAKVVMLGKECVGKTSLVERYVHNRFLIGPYQNTIGAAFVAKPIQVEDKVITLGIWDTAGSERYEAMSRMYYRGAKAAIVCYDLTDCWSFARAKFWVTELQKSEEQCRIYLCGTKGDLIEGNRSLRKVDYHDAQDYADGKGPGLLRPVPESPPPGCLPFRHGPPPSPFGKENNLGSGQSLGTGCRRPGKWKCSRPGSPGGGISLQANSCLSFRSGKLLGNVHELRHCLKQSGDLLKVYFREERNGISLCLLPFRQQGPEMKPGCCAGAAVSDRCALFAEEKGVDLAQKKSSYFYCCHH